MKYRYVFTEQARDDFSLLPQTVQKMIIRKLKYYFAQPDPMAYAKYLKGWLFGTVRFRVGDYRLIAEKEVNGEWHILHIIHIAHRKDIYD